ncbi:HD domain-containing protein [Hymenobacter sp. J193]|uniref:HD domain-containing protein n=1 Tax=Hymenobacter sp. J193 TaxID=2898429 RepID=UPI002150DB9C|nr:HD domain-containing protein [Hymenobacter sp. J193]MCR5890116.1 HD domain-containing protein [Hymenobacter sp. J193]
MPLSSADLIARTADFVREKFLHEGSGHDWEHIRRVWQTARALAAETPGANPLVTELAALLHDVADWKFHGGDEEAGPRAARAWLQSLDVAEPVIGHVETIIREISFKGLGVPTPMSTSEGELVQDADRLDAIGAIGVARAFAYGGHKGRPLHDPSVPPVAHSSFESYKTNAGPTINQLL